MALIPILRNASATIIRTPLLWFFSALAVLTNDLTTMVQNDSTWFGCLSLLLVPIALLAYAGQIRSVQLHQEGTPTSISEVIRYCTQKLGQILAVLIVSVLLFIILLFVLFFFARLLLQQEVSQNVRNSTLYIAFQVTSAMMIFALCAIVISNLPLWSGLRTFFRAIKKDALTILILVSVFSGFSYFFAIYLYPMIFENLIRFVGYILASLILQVTQSAVFIFAYLHYSEEAPTIGSIAKSLEEEIHGDQESSQLNTDR